jgi:hypothetical protein
MINIVNAFKKVLLFLVNIIKLYGTKYNKVQKNKAYSIVDISEVELRDMLVVPEELVVMCSEQMGVMYGTQENNFDVVLKQGGELKSAGRTPIYLCTQDMKHIYVTSVESINKQYN